MQYRLPFGGGSGAGVNINPIAFLVVQNGNVKLLPVNHFSAVDKLLDYMPDAIDKVNTLISKQLQIKCDEKAKKEGVKEVSHQKEKAKETAKEKQTSSTVTKTKPRRGRTPRTAETFEYEYNEFPPAEEILINLDDTEDFDD